MAKATNKGADGEQRVEAPDNQDAANATATSTEEQSGTADASSYVEVRLNPRLVERAGLKQVEIDGSYFYRDAEFVQHATEEQTKVKDPDSGLQYLVTRKGA